MDSSAQTAGGSFDLTFTVNTDKYQQNTLEKVDGAVITVTPSRDRRQRGRRQLADDTCRSADHYHKRSHAG